MNFKTELKNLHLSNSEVKYRCPSNIALVKYWGKHGNQLPANSSISFTLSKAYSPTHNILAGKAVI
jgi:mevalonate pyrophosphate decarboxylase